LTQDQQDSNLTQAAEIQKEPSPWRDMIETILLALLVFVIIQTLTVRVKVYNISMRPTLEEGYMVLVNKWAYRNTLPKRGDIIVCHNQGQDNQDYIKRVIGVPGDEVVVRSQETYINGVMLSEPYIFEKANWSGVWSVPEGKFFVLGDNRNNSSDSQDWGFVDQTWVVGKAVFIYFPFNRIGILDHPDLLSP
jgi:signal peptidase I